MVKLFNSRRIVIRRAIQPNHFVWTAFCHCTLQVYLPFDLFAYRFHFANAFWLVVQANSECVCWFSWNFSEQLHLHTEWHETLSIKEFANASVSSCKYAYATGKVWTDISHSAHTRACINLFITQLRRRFSLVHSICHVWKLLRRTDQQRQKFSSRWAWVLCSYKLFICWLKAAARRKESGMELADDVTPCVRLYCERLCRRISATSYRRYKTAK